MFYAVTCSGSLPVCTDGVWSTAVSALQKSKISLAVVKMAINETPNGLLNCIKDLASSKQIILSFSNDYRSQNFIINKRQKIVFFCKLDHTKPG